MSKTEQFIRNRQVWANLPVKDVKRTRKFYESLGFKLNGDHKSGHLVSFFAGRDDLIIHFFREDMFKEASVGNAADLSKGSEIMYTIGANSRMEVDTWADQAEKAGGTVFAKPAELQSPWYGCGFTDPDGHKWNVFYNGK
ncbi:MAG: VOC family protein [Balneolaceae bacterium]|nr:VOC family protein [Balneolaceae bacterium]